MKNIKLSLIIPIYNAEKYLTDCLDSVLLYKDLDLEVLLIDDGSSDNSYNICKKYQKKDKRVVLIHQENSGVSSARNRGLEVAKGKYIGFVDSDDILDENWFLILNYINDADIYYFSERLPIVKTKNDLVRFITGYNSLNICFAGPFSKIIKRDIINDNIKFNENLINGEDMLFNLNCLINCNTFEVIQHSFYNYRNFVGSATKKFDNKIFDSDKLFQNELLSLSFDKDLKNEIAIYNAQMAVFVLLQRISYLKKYNNSKIYYKFLSDEPYKSSMNYSFLINKKYHIFLYLFKLRMYYLIFVIFKLRRIIKLKKSIFYFSKI